MIQASSLSAYAEIECRLPECCRPVYQAIFENPGICIGEIGAMLRMQNSTVSGRVNDLIEDRLVHYILDLGGHPSRRLSEVSGKAVQMLRANDVFTVDVEQIKQREKRKPIADSRGPERFKTQGSLFSDINNSKAA